MITELITYWLTPCKKTFKEMGFLEAAIGLGARHQRCKQSWQPHLSNSRETILFSMASVKGHSKAVILGSGLLLDIPLGELAGKFDQVILVDVVHLPRVRKLMKAYDNVALIEADISGVIPVLMDCSEDLRLDSNILKEADFVISANILSQLSHYPLEYLEKTHKPVPPGFAKTVTQNHLDLLSSLPGKVCLITETNRIYYQSDEINQIEDPLHGIILPAPDKTWLWEIAPPPEFKRNIGIRLEVAAFVDFIPKV